MKELLILLENFWISKEENKELYYRIKDSLPTLKPFLTEKLGYHTIVNPYLIKLEKLPGKAESWMGIQQFESTMEYVFLCLLLMFLEDRGREDQFVLSNITEYIQANYPGDEKVDWTLFRHRRSLIKVLKFADDIGMIKADDGDEQGFANDSSIEVLYESTGLSRYFVRSFSTNILNYSSYRDIENDDLVEMDKDRGIIRRQRVYRRLIMSPVVYNEGPDDPDYAYIKNKRSMLENDIENYIGCSLHVHRNGAMLMLPENHVFKDCFPGTGAISDIVLQMNHLIIESIKSGELKMDGDDTINVSMAAFSTMTGRLKMQYSSGWSKEYREMGHQNLTEGILNYMQSFNMIQVAGNGKEVRIMPLCGKIAGVYNEDFMENSESLKEAAADGV